MGASIEKLLILETILVTQLKGANLWGNNQHAPMNIIWAFFSKISLVKYLKSYTILDGERYISSIATVMPY